MKKTFLLIIALLFFFVPCAFAHQPRLVENEDYIVVQNPEISQAFYAELKGKPQTYEINSDKDFVLYANILVPDISGIEKNVSFEIYKTEAKKNDLLLRRLDGENFEWTSYYEEFAGDNYFKGPEFKEDVVSGKYLIKVSSPDNLGKYVLAIGDIESFTPKETLKTIKDLPKLKKYFDKSPLLMFCNLIGLFLLAALAVLIIFAYIVYRVIKRLKK